MEEKMKQIKVLIIAAKMDVGGIENQLMHLLRNADRSRFRIDFTTTMDDPYYKAEIESLGSKCIRIPAPHERFYIPYCKALYRIMKEEQYDIVHSHELFHSGMVLRIAKAAGVPQRFVHAHNWSDAAGANAKTSLVRRMYNRLMQREILACGTHFAACSTYAGRFLYGEKMLEKPNYHLVYNSVDTSKFIRNYDITETGEFCGDGWINVLQVGRFSDVKNQLFTAEIARELKQRGQRIRILCAGNNGNEYETRVRGAIEQYGLHEHMLLLGVRDDIDVLMRKSKAFLLPSVYEGMPLVMIEAQAAGLSCVTADTYSHEVDFGLGNVSWLSLNQSASEWADAVEYATTQERLPKEAVSGAVNRGGFDSAIFAQKICKLYEDSVNNT